MSEISQRTKPGQLWTAIIILYVQGVINGAVGLLFVYLAAEEADHGREAPELSITGYLSIVLAAVLVAGAVLLTRGIRWARVPVAVVEGIGIVNGLIVIASGAFLGVVGLALCVVVLVFLFHREVNAWFRPGPAPRP